MVKSVIWSNIQWSKPNSPKIPIIKMLRNKVCSTLDHIFSFHLTKP